MDGLDSTTPATIRVLGMGNVLLADDAVGPYAVRLLDARYELGPAVEVEDVGTPGLDLTPFLRNVRAVVVVDTVSADAAPGTIVVYRDHELFAGPPPARTSPHEPGLREALMATELIGASPQSLVLVGVVPMRTSTDIGLSSEVAGALDELLERLIAELARLGVEVRRREPPLEPDLWWETPPNESPR